MILIINILISVSDFNSQSNLSLSPLTYVVVQSLSRIQLSANPWTAARKVSLSFSILPEFAQTHVHWVDDAIQPSHPLSPPSSPALHLSQHESFPMSHFFTSGDQSIGASASALPMNTQGWFPLGLTGLISLLFKRLSKVFSSTTVQKHQFFSTQPSLWSTLTAVHDHWKNHRFDYTDIYRQSDVSIF